ncbi:MAG: hypothetical protein Q7R47_06425, partial [Candidatus Diapherotrites archaeon]|nr:hypothetical protein [Candidatus Diapherotrites archaeon]
TLEIFSALQGRFSLNLRLGAYLLFALFSFDKAFGIFDHYWKKETENKREQNQQSVLVLKSLQKKI